MYKCIFLIISADTYTVYISVFFQMLLLLILDLMEIAAQTNCIRSFYLLVIICISACRWKSFILLLQTRTCAFFPHQSSLFACFVLGGAVCPSGKMLSSFCACSGQSMSCLSNVNVSYVPLL